MGTSDPETAKGAYSAVYLALKVCQYAWGTLHSLILLAEWVQASRHGKQGGWWTIGSSFTNTVTPLIFRRLDIVRSCLAFFDLVSDVTLAKPTRM